MRLGWGGECSLEGVRVGRGGMVAREARCPQQRSVPSSPVAAVLSRSHHTGQLHEARRIALLGDRPGTVAKSRKGGRNVTGCKLWS